MTKAVAIAWKKKDGSLVVVDFDALVSEQHTFSAMITEHPVEDGSVLTDHIRANPDRVSLDFFITNTPITINGPKIEGEKHRKFGMEDAIPAAVGAIADVLPGGMIPFGGLLFSKKFDRVSAVFTALRDAARAATRFDVYTTLGLYPGMVLEGLTAPKTAQSGNALTFSASFREINIVSTEVAEVPQTDVKHKPKVNRGPKASDPVTDTVGGSALDALTGLGKVAA